MDHGFDNGQLLLFFDIIDVKLLILVYIDVASIFQNATLVYYENVQGV
jgi:hypothetical protein